MLSGRDGDIKGASLQVVFVEFGVDLRCEARILLAGGHFLNQIFADLVAGFGVFL